MGKMKRLAVCLLAIGVGAAGGCGGPSGKDWRQTLFLSLDSDNATTITNITFVVTPNGAEFAGDHGACTLGSVIPDTPTPTLDSVVEDNDQLVVTVAATMHAGNLIALCEFNADTGITPEFNIEVQQCKNGGITFPNPNESCTMIADVSQVAVCGNGVTEGAETCDEGTGGTPTDTATCDSDCSDVSCGDDHLNTAAGEECDDGNTSAQDVCSATCKEQCVGGAPNGVEQGDEECDEGGETATCSSKCLLK